MTGETPVLFDSGGDPLCGMLYTSAAARGGVVLCNPLFEERKSAQGVLVEMARSLSAQGFAVLRFDYRGCGDSAGAFDAFGADDWQEDIRNACAFLRHHYPGMALGLLGLRLGAALTLRCAGSGQDLAFVVAWEPALDGAAYLQDELRKKLIKEMVTFGHSTSTRRALLDTLEAGGTVDFDGYPLSAKLYRSVCELTEQTTLHALACPALCVRVSAGQVPTQTGAAARPTHAEWRCVPGPPFWNLIGLSQCPALIDLTTDWIASYGGASRSSGPSTEAEVRVTALAGPPIEPLLFHAGGSALHGIVHRPATAHDNGTAVIFLHGWSGSRLGPHRMFVKTARRLAGRGFTCLRFDARGRGDSEGSAADTTIASMIEDGRAAVKLLKADSKIKRICLLGICSGAKVAIGTAVSEPGIAGLVLWSAEPLAPLRTAGREARRTTAALRQYLAKALRPATWSKLLRGRVHLGLVRKALRSDEKSGRNEARDEAVILQRWSDYGGAVLFVYGANDPDTRHAADRYCAFCDATRIPYECHKVDRANHSFYGLAWEAEVIDTTEQWLMRRSRPTRVE